MKRDEAMKRSTEYFNGDAMAAGVFLDKYALTTPEGDILEGTPDDMHRRMAKEFARIEAKYPNPLSEELIFELFRNFRYVVPQGSPMAGIGNPYQLMTLSNCYTIEPPFDSYGGILKSDQELVQLMKRRAGVGLDISNIRPSGMTTKNAAKTTDGIGIFMERFSNSCREVAQGGRRGALMLTISVHHPEIETFINIKRDLKKVTGANISIRLTDEFMKAVEGDKEVELRWPVNSANPSIRRTVSAKKIWDQIVDSAWSCAEPGLLFWDTVLRNTPSDAYEEFASVGVNPCSEIVLSKDDSCRLMLINALSFVDKPFTPEASFDGAKYKRVVGLAQRLMDDMIDLELECIDRIIAKINSDEEPEIVKRTEMELWKRIRTSCERGRRTGLGVTAIGDTIAALGQRYGSKESIETVDSIYGLLAAGAYGSTIQLAKERGPFPAYDREKERNHPFIKKMEGFPGFAEGFEKYGRRNIALTTTAPAGSVSILTQTTSGIEPAFEVVYKRRRKIMQGMTDVKVDFVDELGDKWAEYEVYHPQFKKWMEVSGKKTVEESPYWKSRANDVDWKASVDIQATAQNWICHAISKTCNLPNDAPKELVSEIYFQAWKSGCKGFTVYRDGSRSGVLVTDSSPKKEDSGNKLVADVLEVHHAPKRPKEMPCDVHSVTVAGEKWTLFIGKLGDKPYEIMGGLSKFINIPKRVKHGKIIKHNGPQNPVARYDLHYDFEKGPEEETVIKDITNVFDNAIHAAFTRTISLALRHGAPVQYVMEQIQKGSEKEDDLFSFSRALSRVLKTYIVDGTKVSSDKICPECGSKDLVYQEGCASCPACGYSKCK